MKPIKNVQTKDYIAEAIRNEILAGHMEAGEELTQELLAETLGVSRMPIREALQTLVQEGFVERLPNRHMQVVALDKMQIVETFHIVAGMEAEFITLLIEKQVNLSEIQKMIEKLGQEELLKQQIEIEQMIHIRVAELLNNKYLAQSFDRLLRGYIAYAIQNLGDKEVTINVLKEISKAMTAKDIVKIKELLAKYYQYYAAAFE